MSFPEPLTPLQLAINRLYMEDLKTAAVKKAAARLLEEILCTPDQDLTQKVRTLRQNLIEEANKI